MKKTHTISLLAAALLGSCAVGPDFTAPESALPVTWVHALPPSSAEQDLTTWWNSFGDHQLSGLINAGFINNPDMISAALAIAQAESVLRSTRSNLFPVASSSFGGGMRGVLVHLLLTGLGVVACLPHGRQIFGVGQDER